MPKKIAIVAAMEREIARLVRNWTVRTIEHDGRRYRLFENENSALLCGGIGGQAARRATEAIIREVNPVQVLSVGFAGALPAMRDGQLKVGDVLRPRTVINVADGVRTLIDDGEGILVSSPVVADRDQKIRLGEAYGAIAVDMEAAAVAQGAQARGILFMAVKAISDNADFDMPALDRFIANDGTFRSFGFACHMALRPWMWPTTVELARNSARASRALCTALADYLARDITNLGLSSESSTPNLNQIKLNKTVDSLCAGAHTRMGVESHTRPSGKQ
jgi:adenosylhomocysteine nucleosidase